MTTENPQHLDRIEKLAAVQTLADRAAVTDLPSRLTACLDDHRFEDLRAILTEGATGTTPGGAAEDREALIAMATRNHEEFGRLQHVLTNVLVDLEGDSASVRANVVGYFGYEAEPAPARVSNARYRMRAVRTEDGWRVSHLEIQQVFRDERGPVAA